MEDNIMETYVGLNENICDFSKADEHTTTCKSLRKISFMEPQPWIFDFYENINDIQNQEYIVRPCLTGLAQCMRRNNITIFKKIEYDINYIKKYLLHYNRIIKG